MSANVTARFVKYQALGNDFIVVTPDFFDHADGDRSAVARALCDRHFGVGADGILVVGPARSVGATASMEVINADGSVPEMCGNGIRCVAHHLSQQAGIGRDITIDTGAGPLTTRVTESSQSCATVAVDMGPARLTREAVHARGDNDDETVTLAIGGREWRFHPASMGNPHAVCFVSDAPHELLAEIGPIVTSHHIFAERINVELVQPSADGLQVAVWERGAGPTLACGTGACAVAAVAHRIGLVDGRNGVSVHLPGGELTIVVEDEQPESSAVTNLVMIGPARRVFAGVLDDQLSSSRRFRQAQPRRAAEVSVIPEESG